LIERALDEWFSNCSRKSSSLQLDFRPTVLKARYNGLIPNLLQPDNNDDFDNKRDNAIRNLKKSSQFTDYNVVRIIQNFVSGEENLVLPEMLEFIDVYGEKTLWIPRHIKPFIKTFAVSNESKVSD
jgi:hypothetical protein